MFATYVDSNGAGNTGDVCRHANIEEGTPEIILVKSASQTSGIKPYDTIQFTLRFRHDRADSTADTVNPHLVDFIPEEYEFLGIDSVSGLAGKPELICLAAFSALGSNIG